MYVWGVFREGGITCLVKEEALLFIEVRGFNPSGPFLWALQEWNNIDWA
jgi:hypothetical protein